MGDTYDDLNAGVFNVSRQRLLADQLRKQGEEPTPQGQMVSGHYVAPSWAEHLSGLANTVGGAYMGEKADEAKLASDTAINQAREKWEGGLPKAVEAQMGPERIEGLGGREHTVQDQISPAQPVTTDRILKHTLAGMRIPGNEKAAGLYNTGATNELSREDKQAEARMLQHTTLQAAREKQQSELIARREELERRLEDRGLDRESRERIQQQMAAMQGQIAAGVHEIGMMNAETNRLKAQGAAKDAKDKQDKTTQDEKTAAGYLLRMNDQEKLMLASPEGSDQGLVGKAVGGIPYVGEGLRPYAMNKNQQSLRAAQEEWVRAKLRKESGASIPTEEMDREIRTYFWQPGEHADIRTQKAAARATAIKSMEIAAGREFQNPRLQAQRGGAGGSWASPVKVATQADVDKLQSGTPFIGPDGKQYTKD